MASFPFSASPQTLKSSCSKNLHKASRMKRLSSAIRMVWDMCSLRNPWQAAGRAATYRPTDGTRKGYLNPTLRVERVYPVETVLDAGHDTLFSNTKNTKDLRAMRFGLGVISLA